MCSSKTVLRQGCTRYHKCASAFRRLRNTQRAMKMAGLLRDVLHLGCAHRQRRNERYGSTFKAAAQVAAGFP
jgi:hypothetical protein